MSQTAHDMQERISDKGHCVNIKAITQKTGSRNYDLYRERQDAGSCSVFSAVFIIDPT